MPLYNWDAMAAADFRWLRERARRSADLFDGYRVDHLVGFYRTYGWPHAEGQPAFFTPSEEADQVALGERVLTIFKEPGADIIAEDLGIVPDFVRASMAALGVPGFRILRWERRWHEHGQPFRDTGEYPAMSVAASGTHDTEPLMAWWSAAAEDERGQLNDLPMVQHLTKGAGILSQQDDAQVRDVLLEALFASGSDLLLLPVQDVFGWHDRINVPGTVTPENWTFRLPWPCDRMSEVPEARARQARLREWAVQHHRL
jgi:4-alpha-glucanotransferase